MSEPYEGMWDFKGACAPVERNDKTYRSYNQETFTLGCFQWVKRARGNSLKKGKVQYRVKGRTDSPADAYEKARQFCAKKNREMTA